MKLADRIRRYTEREGVSLHGKPVPACLWCGGIERRVALLFAEPPLICTCPGGLSEGDKP